MKYSKTYIGTEAHNNFLYSPTKLYVEADEKNKSGLVSVIEKIEDFNIVR